MKPTQRPARPFFSSGPCAKRPGWSVDVLDTAYLARSHRSSDGKARIQDVMDRSRTLLGIPDDYRIGIVPGSDTGAVEMALWSMLGPRGVDVLAWESFSQGWITDVVKQLRLPDVRCIETGYGQLPDLNAVDCDRDVVFVWNGTTSGVRVPDGDWIAGDRGGITICDATSAVFAMSLPWEKLDAVTYSWQKVMGGEAAHGVLIVSPRAVERLESYQPPWPMPKLFRLTKGGKLNEQIFTGSTINTPSMLCVEDHLDSLKWAETIGGAPALLQRSDDNLTAIARWVAASSWVDFLAARPEWRSNTSVCLSIIEPDFAALAVETQRDKVKEMVGLLEAEEVAYDLNAYRDAPPGLRIWAGATIEVEDIQALLPWITWAFREVS